ncbi:MAG TPA: S8 family serine peptidase [Blastocatellia bacterium]|nr:S8 family serine peptidase [Blastocatellia bacterium]HMX25046.1 S8 family serine peptidase [Blastocatellia bacterium]HMZ16373.1 S8 family serine peptidase [Blastocatellia bacterium]HNG28828.1 S8 family serine peptidase [Blastocatellia bacterium]
MRNPNKQVRSFVGSAENDDPIFSLPSNWQDASPQRFTRGTAFALSLPNIPELWRIAGTQGAGIKIALLDTGASHPALRIRGKVNFIGGDAEDILDEEGHGTMVAGVIGAQGASTSVLGVAPAADLYVAKVIRRSSGGTVGALRAGIKWALQQGVHIINISLGSGQNIAAIHDEIRTAVSREIFVICAAGNGGEAAGVAFPARYEECLAVGAVTAQNHRWDVEPNLGSAVGQALDVVALGEGILSTFPPHLDASGERKGRGTSLAAPFVTGVVALALAKDRGPTGNNPIETLNQLRNRLQSTATDLLPDEPDPDPEFGHGRINPASFLAEV